MMALYYSKIFASQAELEVEVRGHLTTAAELRSAMAEAERAGAAKSAFLAKMTHELRTPLNAVIGYSQMLLEDAEAEGDTQTRVDLEKIHTAGQHLLQLVTDVLDLAKIEAGKMELYNERINVTVLIERAVASCKDLATSNGDKLSVQLDDRLGTIVCDVRKLEQVVTHVLRNAAKFTRNGRITVSARRKHMVQGDKIVVSVRDNGPGISRDSIPELFEQFSVATDSTPTKYGGAGLGLALSLKLCRLMGGNIEVASELGVGSCFTITIPASPKNAAPPVEQMIEAVRPAVTKRLAEPVAETESLRQLPTLGVVNG
jgi:signal transduction histidine kinase